MESPPGWVPEFAGQRPPFAPGNEYRFEAGNEHRVGAGNTLSRRHGAYSATAVAPLAEEIEATARASDSWPAYLADDSYRPAVAAWASSEAICVLLRDHLAQQSLTDAMTDTHSEQTSEYSTKGSSSRTTTGKRTRAALDLLDRWEARASSHRQRLGLDPLSRAKLGKDVTSARVDLAQLLSAERERLEQPNTSDSASSPLSEPHSPSNHHSSAANKPQPDSASSHRNTTTPTHPPFDQGTAQ